MNYLLVKRYVGVVDSEHKTFQGEFSPFKLPADCPYSLTKLLP